MKRWILNLIFVCEVLFIIDFLCNYFGKVTSAKAFYVVLIIVWILLNCILRIPFKRHCVIVSILPALAVIAGMIGYIPWKITSGNLQYASVDDGKRDLYSNHSVMVIVPHEDDEINIAGNVIDQYTKYGSEVHVVFVTNGDYFGLAETRLNEAIDACAYMGVKEDHVIFLGYGDQWSKDGPHLYNSDPGQARISAGGYASTYGLQSHPAYHDGNLYTGDNLLSDMKSVILEYRPDTILCIDYDLHVDHRASSFMFEKAMGEILNEQTEYTPTVLKAYAYNTAWLAENDYYAVNILSTQDVFESPYDQEPEIYEWNNRFRFPVAAENLSRSLVNSGEYFCLKIYDSQEADKHAGSIVNGDKVFWERRTDSVLYTASIETTSGSAALLHDFMLIDSDDVLDMERLPCDGTWIPAESDEERKITVQFDGPKDIYEIVLYDNPSPEDNVLNAVIEFDNGVTMETGELAQTGSASAFVADQKNVMWFTLTLESTEGDRAGLTEMEAYSQKDSLPFSFVKLTDTQGNFVYDYVIDRSGREDFYLYTFGQSLTELSAEEYSVSCDNERCSAVISDGKLAVDCPAGEVCTISVSCNADPSISDSVYIQNPTALQRAAIRHTQKVEQFVYQVYSNDILEKTAFYKTQEKGKALLDRIL